MEQINAMYLFGASGHGKVIKEIIEASGDEVVAFVDDNVEINEVAGKKVLHGEVSLSPMIVSIGVNQVRKKVVEKLDCQFGMAVHPAATVSPSVKIGEGTVVMAGAVINAEAVIGKHCIINTGASVDHECIIEDYVHISPHSTLCGNVHIGEGSWIGAGTVIIPGVKIGRWAVVGAGSVVTKDIPDGVLAVGNRCKIIKTLDVDMLRKTKNGGGKNPSLIFGHVAA